jgi:UrcA family protein
MLKSPFNTPLKTLAIAAISALTAVSAANATSLNDHVAFGYKASELQSSASVQNLYRRIETKAKNACGSKNARALYAKQLSAQCQSALVEDWVANIGDARLQQTHAQARGVRSFASVR